MFNPDYQFEILWEAVIRIIKKWRPKQEYNSETRYRDDLASFLKEEFRKNPLRNITGMPLKAPVILTEKGRDNVDIEVGRNKIGIELKRNLEKKQDADRTIGQIYRYRKDYKGVILVACGKTNNNTWDEIVDLLYHPPQGGRLFTIKK